MKSHKNPFTLLLLTLATITMAASFKIASNHHKVTANSASRAQHASARLVPAGLRMPDRPRNLLAMAVPSLHDPIRTNGTTLIPDHSLMVTDPIVVEDPSLTWDQCKTTSTGNPTGAWTFNELMLAIRNAPPPNQVQFAEQMLTDLLYNFVNPNNVTIGNFTAHARQGALAFFNSWPVDMTSGISCTNHIHQGQCLSLINAPVHLNAIVNRIDIGQNGNNMDQAGQLRFVFGVYPSVNGVCGPDQFNIILEYNVPSSITAQSWASQWAKLSNDCQGGFNANCAYGTQQGQFDADLLSITNQVVLAGDGNPGSQNGSALFDLRTNEIVMAGTTGFWELRQFQLGQQPTPTELVQTAVPQTLDLSFDGGTFEIGTLFCTQSEQTQLPNGCGNLNEFRQLVQMNSSLILNGNFPVPSTLLGASALNGPDDSPSDSVQVYWDSSPTMAMVDPNARVVLAASPRYGDSNDPADPVGGLDGSCNGCHGRETVTFFQQVRNRTDGTASVLSSFLVGCLDGTLNGSQVCENPGTLNSPVTEAVQDPVNTSQVNTFGDIKRRLNCLTKISGTQAPTMVTCNGAGD